jgi:hypothetical protein
MPAYSGRSRASLLAIAPLLIERARAELPDPGVIAAADAAEAARLELIAAVDGRMGAATDRSGASARVVAAERALDRRVSALRAALEALAALGLDEADGLLDAVLPVGTESISSPRGRLQAPAYEALAGRLRAAAALPGAARLEPALSALATDLELWCAEVLVRDEARAALASGARTAEATALELRAALERLDLEVQRAAGGPRAAAYATWADAARGVG